MEGVGLKIDRISEVLIHPNNIDLGLLRTSPLLLCNNK